MNIYPTYVTLHILFAGIWLSFFLIERVLKGRIIKGISVNENLSNYLLFTNLFGITGAIGILLTGILLVLNSGYGFFDMTNNHWLAAKQMILLLILIITFAVVIPTAKEIREKLDSAKAKVSEANYKKLFKANLIINSLVLINFLFAITNRFYA